MPQRRAVRESDGHNHTFFIGGDQALRYLFYRGLQPVATGIGAFRRSAEITPTHDDPFFGSFVENQCCLDGNIEELELSPVEAAMIREFGSIPRAFESGGPAPKEDSDLQEAVIISEHEGCVSAEMMTIDLPARSEPDGLEEGEIFEVMEWVPSNRDRRLSRRRSVT